MLLDLIERRELQTPPGHHLQCSLMDMYQAVHGCPAKLIQWGGGYEVYLTVLPLFS